MGFLVVFHSFNGYIFISQNYFSDWLVIVPPKFKLEPNKPGVVVFKLYVPKDVELKDYFGTVNICIKEL